MHPSSLEKFHWTIAEVTIILFFGEVRITSWQSVLRDALQVTDAETRCAGIH